MPLLPSTDDKKKKMAHPPSGDDRCLKTYVCVLRAAFHALLSRENFRKIVSATMAQALPQPEPGALASASGVAEAVCASPSRLPSLCNAKSPARKTTPDEPPSRLPVPTATRGVASEDRVRLCVETTDMAGAVALFEALGFVRREGKGDSSETVMRRGQGLSVELRCVSHLAGRTTFVLFSKHVETLHARMVLAGWRQVEDAFESPLTNARLTIEFEIT